MFNGLQRKLLWALVFLVIVSNVWVFISVLNNRSQISARMVLSERELASPWYMDEENSGVSLRLEYRVLATEYPDYYHYGSQFPEWLTTDKMGNLGFSFKQLDLQNSSRSASKEVFIALELNGIAYQQSIADLQQKLAEGSKQELAEESDEKMPDEYWEKQLQREMHIESRLFAIDADTELSDLQMRYASQDNVFFVAGVISTIDWYQDKSLKYKQGRIDSLSVSDLYVPYPLNAKFKELGHRDYDDYQSPRYEVDVKFGKQLQPWIADVEFK